MGILASRFDHSIDFWGLLQYKDYQDRNSHYKDKMVSQLFYHYNGDHYIWEDGVYIETGPCP